MGQCRWLSRLSISCSLIRQLGKSIWLDQIGISHWIKIIILIIIWYFIAPILNSSSDKFFHNLSCSTINCLHSSTREQISNRIFSHVSISTKKLLKFHRCFNLFFGTPILKKNILSKWNKKKSEFEIETVKILRTTAMLKNVEKCQEILVFQFIFWHFCTQRCSTERFYLGHWNGLLIHIVISICFNQLISYNSREHAISFDFCQSVTNLL